MLRFPGLRPQNLWRFSWIKRGRDRWHSRLGMKINTDNSMKIGDAVERSERDEVKARSKNPAALLPLQGSLLLCAA